MSDTTDWKARAELLEGRIRELMQERNKALSEAVDERLVNNALRQRVELVERCAKEILRAGKGIDDALAALKKASEFVART